MPLRSLMFAVSGDAANGERRDFLFAYMIHTVRRESQELRYKKVQKCSMWNYWNSAPVRSHHARHAGRFSRKRVMGVWISNLPLRTSSTRRCG